MVSLIQDFEADFLRKVSLKILNSGIILKSFQILAPYRNSDLITVISPLTSFAVCTLLVNWKLHTWP